MGAHQVLKCTFSSLNKDSIVITRKILLTMDLFTIENNRDPNSKWPTTDLSNTLHNAIIGSNDTAAST